MSTRVCPCGEPEDGGEFGWFDADDGLVCNACGGNPLRPKRPELFYLRRINPVGNVFRLAQNGEWFHEKYSYKVRTYKTAKGAHNAADRYALDFPKDRVQVVKVP